MTVTGNNPAAFAVLRAAGCRIAKRPRPDRARPRRRKGSFMRNGWDHSRKGLRHHLIAPVWGIKSAAHSSRRQAGIFLDRERQGITCLIRLMAAVQKSCRTGGMKPDLQGSLGLRKRGQQQGSQVVSREKIDAVKAGNRPLRAL